MADEDDVDRLLETWEEAFERGDVLTAEELAHDRPDLVAELARQIETLRDSKPIESTLLGGGRGTADLAESDLQLINNRYRPVELLGSGAEGAVWKAFDENMGRHVALKLPQFDGSRLIDEAQLIAKLKHPHIVTVYDAGIDAEGTAFVAYELMTGGTLAGRIRDLGGRVPTDQALTWTTQLAAALHAVHAIHAVHRDVKPINILLDGDGQAVLGDFGIVINVASQPAGSPAGTSAYMSPEQVARHKPDLRSDVYSLALVVHEMLAGCLPPPGPADAAAAEREIAIGGTRQVSPKVPAQLQKVIQKALSARPAERFESAPQFARELVAAWRGSVQRRWAATAALVLLGGVFAVGWWIRAEQRRAREIGDQLVNEAQLRAREGMKIADAALGKVQDVVEPPSLHQLLAVAKTNMLHEQYAIAEAEYTQALELSPGNSEALRNRGLSRLSMGRLDAAVLDFDAVLASEPDDGPTLRHRASAHGLLRDFPRAIADLERAIVLMPNATELPEKLATIYAIRSHERFGEGDYAGAKADMDATIRLAPQPAINYSRRSACWFHLGEYERSLDDISEAIRREPSNADFFGKRAMVLDKLGRADEAEQDRKKLEQLVPNSRSSGG